MRVEDLNSVGTQYTLPNLGRAKLALLSEKQEKKPFFLGFGKIFDMRKNRQLMLRKIQVQDEINQQLLFIIV